MIFKELDLDPRILQALEEAGFDTPTPIQATAIPEILKGVDLRASAQTGTGKTAAFLLPALHRLATPSPKKGMGPRILVLVPTRELAMQVAKEAERHSKYLPKVKTVCIYGGAPYPLQRRQLSRPFEILVATPGRLLDHLGQGRIDFSRIEMLVLDEADRLLDMGFIEPIEQIAAATPPTRQTLLFSATLKGSVLQLSNRLMNKPQELCVIPAQEKYDHIKQSIFHVDDLPHKLAILKKLIDDPSINQGLIFTSTKRYAEELADELEAEGYSAAALHGDMHQRQRERTLANLRKGHVRFLVATDVAARGIDVCTITHVFNFDLPRCVEDYTHRIGRTGRAGATGVAFSFANAKDRSVLRQIEVFIKQKLALEVIPGLEPSSKFQEVRKEGNRFGKRSFPPKGGSKFNGPGNDRRRKAFKGPGPARPSYPSRAS